MWRGTLALEREREEQLQVSSCVYIANSQCDVCTILCLCLFEVHEVLSVTYSQYCAVSVVAVHATVCVCMHAGACFVSCILRMRTFI